MKKITTFLSILLIAGIAATAQEKKQAILSPKAKTESANVSVSYGQPSKRGREIFGGLVPYGEVWRTGANEATEITFKKDVAFGGQAISAGTYTLFTIPGKDQWVIILNPVLKQWGAFGYDKIKDKDVAHIKANVKHGKQQEKLQIKATDQSLTIAWDTVEVMVPIEIK